MTRRRPDLTGRAVTLTPPTPHRNGAVEMRPSLSDDEQRASTRTVGCALWAIAGLLAVLLGTLWAGLPNLVEVLR